MRDTPVVHAAIVEVSDNALGAAFPADIDGARTTHLSAIH